MRNSRLMIRNIVFFILISTALPAMAQRRQVVMDRCDYVYLKSKEILRGKILEFDQADGDITFQDEGGRYYSWARSDYRFFEYDKPCRYRNRNSRDSITLNPRKKVGFTTQIGISTGYVNVGQDLVNDGYYLQGPNSFAMLPTGAKLYVGTFLNPRLTAGLTADLGVLSDIDKYFAVGGRMTYTYDKETRNVAAYLPIELMLGNMSTELNYTVNDTIFNVFPNDFTYPGYRDLRVSINFLQLSMGHGFGFILPNQKAINLEMAVFNNFTLSTKYPDYPGRLPDATFRSNGLKLACTFAF
ncbi:MAG: hypothetical protein H6606_07875 [Flavobacteriales bacterium]|nr:hypothetical protein [Flavobacteriales bacterium]